MEETFKFYRRWKTGYAYKHTREDGTFKVYRVKTYKEADLIAEGLGLIREGRPKPRPKSKACRFGGNATRQVRPGKNKLFDPRIVYVCCEAISGYPHSLTNAPDYKYDSKEQELHTARKLEWYFLTRYAGLSGRAISAIYNTPQGNVATTLTAMRRRTRRDSPRFDPALAMQIEDIKQTMLIMRAQDRKKAKSGQ